MQPDFITQTLLLETTSSIGKKKELPALEKIRLERFQEGKCAQVLHTGPYADEPATIEKLPTTGKFLKFSKNFAN